MRGWSLLRVGPTRSAFFYQETVGSPENEDFRMAKPMAYNLRYLGVIPQTGRRDYGFQIEDEDKHVRVVVLEIETGVFERRELMFQEAPDLCYQKVLADLEMETADCRIGERVSVTATDICHYRELHPASKPRRAAIRKLPPMEG